MSSLLIILLLFIIFSSEARPEDHPNREGPTTEKSVSSVDISFFEGDIALSSNSSSNQLGGVQGTYVVNDAKIWPQGAVPFKIDTGSIVLEEHQELIRLGLKDLEEVATCLRFNEVTGEAVGDHILFRAHGDGKYPGKGCWSYVGRQGGSQVINLEPPYCMELGHIKHEVLHSLGAIHEHSRPDRDKHIRILEENIPKEQLKNFKIAQWSYYNEENGVEVFGAPYDLYSIMHYPNNAFGKNNSRTIEAVNPKIMYFGSTGDLTLTDIIKLNLLNRCEIDSNTIVDYLHEAIIRDDSDVTADILKTVEENNDKLEDDSKNLKNKVEAQEKRIVELEMANIDYKEKLDLLIWDMEKIKHSFANIEQNVDKNVEVVQEALESHEIESKEIFSRLESRASQETLLDDTVEDLSLLNIRRTCQEYADEGIKRSGYFWLDPDGPLNPPNHIRVWCNISSEQTVTEVLHDSEMTTSVTQCPQPGCYVRNVTYKSSRSQLRSLMEISEHCYQDIRYDCTLAPFRKGSRNIDYAFWIGDNGKKNIHWHDFDNKTSSDDHFCACHSKSDCFGHNLDGNKCHCDSSMAFGQFDEGRITDIHVLPIRQLRFGGLHSRSSAQHTLGRLKCIGRKPIAFGSSCEALRIAGNYMSGYYNVGEGDDIKMVFCNMSINPWDDPGLEIFTENLSDEIEAIHANFSNQLEDLELAINQTIQNVETTVRKMPGPPGKQGQKGSQGNVGLKGNKGDVGLTGHMGPKGDKGVQGFYGPKGKKGESGQTGIKGMTGPSGLKGTKGSMGRSGPKGNKGQVGRKGEDGSKGVGGQQGVKGEKGNYGHKGNIGIKGDKGQMGKTGNKGSSGINGSPGMKGDKGAQGLKGERGKCELGAYVIRSCQDIKVNCPDGKSGIYSIYPNGDKHSPMKVYCDLSNGGSGTCETGNLIQNCKDLKRECPNFISGIYSIWADAQKLVNVYCEMDTDGGGWTVMAYLRNKQQWDYKIFADNGVVGDVNGGFSTGATLKEVNGMFTEKLILYLSLEELKQDLGRQWMINQRPDAVSFSSIDTNRGWSYRDSFGYTKADAGNVCTHGCGKYRGFGMFSDHTGSVSHGYCGTQGADNMGCRDGNNICWVLRGKGLSCQVTGGRRCALLSGPGEGVIYAVR